MADDLKQLEGGAYEVIRARLEKHANDLRERMDRLNAERLDVFGGMETKLLATERVATEHNCQARDLVAIGPNRFLFGYNIQFGLKQTTDVRDVFAVYDFNADTKTFVAVADDLVLGDPRFIEDFRYIFKFYREAVFKKFLINGPHLYMAMRAGKSLDDVKVFKWLINGDGTLSYLGNRFDHEYVYPTQQEFTWIRAHRDMQRGGLHPHISIEDKVFVETVGGDLTIKIEDNTNTGQGIYSEPVTDPDQTLDDSEIFYAIVGSLILLKVLPYRESLHRYLVFNQKTNTVARIDGIGASCVLLPEDQGVIFANGYVLQTGEIKTFDHGIANMRFERRVVSANGEDVLFVFHNRELADYVLLSYNRVKMAVETPTICAGVSIFADGTMVYFRGNEDPQRYHALQVWQTPYYNESFAAKTAKKPDSFLFKIGNSELVRAMSECRAILTLVSKDDSFSGLYLDLGKHSGDLLDAYFWLDSEECQKLSEPLREIKRAAQSAVGEFEKVTQLRQTATQKTADARAQVEKISSTSKTTIADEMTAFVHLLTNIRKLRGEVIGLKDVRYVDPAVVTELEGKLVEASDLVSERTVNFLGTDKALASYAASIDQQETQIPNIKGSVAADQSLEALDHAATELEMLIDVVGGLKIKDPVQTTAIVEKISALYARLNGVRAAVRNKRKELSRGESQAEFAARLHLLSQATANYLDLADSPAKCDEALTKLMVQVEELEGKFSEFDDYVEQLGAKRDEIYSALDGRRAQLLEARGRRAGGLLRSAERILQGMRSRVATFSEPDEIQGYFAGDLMVEKLREIIAELHSLGDSVKADDIETRLKTLREDSVRQLKDKRELFADGGASIQIGKHKFSVNTQALELTVVPHDEQMAFHLSGTKFLEPIIDEEFNAARDLWNREVISESPLVYRAEYLAWMFLERGIPSAEPLAGLQSFMQERATEGYIKGIHDADAVQFVKMLSPMREKLGMARFGPDARSLAMVFWYQWAERSAFQMRIDALRAASALGSMQSGRHELLDWLESGLSAYLENSHSARICATSAGDDAVQQVQPAAAFLYQTLLNGMAFVVSPLAHEYAKQFQRKLIEKLAEPAFEKSLAAYESDLDARFRVVLDWFRAATELPPSSSSETPHMAWLIEAAAHRLYPLYDSRAVVDVDTNLRLDSLLGSHPLIESSSYRSDYHALRMRLEQFRRIDVPRYESFTKYKHRLIADKRQGMRLESFKPKVMSAFVRNRLIDEVYLPLIGDNLAKQLGATGAQTRTDRMGLLLLISPPGYGKTTLVEYIADRLGITYIKINGPALGHNVTSLDPGEAPNAAAREEIERLNLALEMGDNVMIVIDDIQHTNPEFLQKFISLCDGQRKIEGVYQGKAKTYDLRGRKVVVVMAGNPYTETGSKFQIPDMLANRADTYNLGDILGGHSDAFKASYIENALTSNPILSKLASRSPKDIHVLMRVAQTGSRDGADFEGNHTPTEIEEMLAVTKHLLRVRDVISRVNEEYIRSAAQEDSYRTEPSFRLQGSYRNMNRIAEKILPLMSEAEIEQIIMDHYRGESQNLTNAAEANVLKLHEILGLLDEKQLTRWTEIKKEFNKKKLLGGAGESDPVARVVAQMSQFTDGLDAIRAGIQDVGSRYAQPQNLAEKTVNQMKQIIEGLRAVPVQVEIKVVPVQDESKSIENIDTNKSPIDIVPSITQGDDSENRE